MTEAFMITMILPLAMSLLIPITVSLTLRKRLLITAAIKQYPVLGSLTVIITSGFSMFMLFITETFEFSNYTVIGPCILFMVSLLMHSDKLFPEYVYRVYTGDDTRYFIWDAAPVRFYMMEHGNHVRNINGKLMFLAMLLMFSMSSSMIIGLPIAIYSIYYQTRKFITFYNEYKLSVI